MNEKMHSMQHFVSIQNHKQIKVKSIKWRIKLHEPNKKVISINKLQTEKTGPILHHNEVPYEPILHTSSNQIN